MCSVPKGQKTGRETRFLSSWGSRRQKEPQAESSPEQAFSQGASPWPARKEPLSPARVGFIPTGRHVVEESAGREGGRSGLAATWASRPGLHCPEDKMLDWEG